MNIKTRAILRPELTTAMLAIRAQMASDNSKGVRLESELVSLHAALHRYLKGTD